MFKKCLLVVVFVFLALTTKNVLAQENRGGFVIDNFQVDILVKQNSIIEVNEKIEVNFSERRHGIFRDIPVEYKNDTGFDFNLKLSNISIKDEQGKPYQFEVSNYGNNKRIKIGNPNLEVVGKQIYNIKYEIKKGIRYFEDHDELYWNPIGTGWTTSIEKASSQVRFEEGINYIENASYCYTGSFGSKESDCLIGEDQNGVLFTAKHQLNSNEGMTIVLSFPKGEIYQPSFWENIWLFMVDNWGLGIPLVVFSIMFVVWSKKGRDRPFKEIVIAQYDSPDKLTPGELGYLMKEKYTGRFLAGDVVSLAVKGFLKIEELEMNKLKKFLKARPEYQFEKIKDWENAKNLTEHEKEILTGLFGLKSIGEKIKLSDKKDFYKNKKEIDLKIKKQTEEYFFQSFWNKKVAYILVGVLVFPLGFFALLLGRTDIFLGIVFSVGIVALFSAFMSKKTSKGAEAFWKAQGFKHYIDVAEKDRAKFYAKENMFEAVLPYAIVFDNVDNWAKTFNGIIKEPPEWYSGANAFSIVAFSNSLNTGLVDSSNSASASPSSSGSGGGGSSGGGGGGGGGGSW